MDTTVEDKELRVKDNWTWNTRSVCKQVVLSTSGAKGHCSQDYVLEASQQKTTVV